jgi:hypothetical protein
MHDFISIETPKNFERILPQYQADWVRVAVLREHGGFWMDISMVFPTSYLGRHWLP